VSPKRAHPSLLAGEKNVVHSFHDYFAGDGNPETTSLGYNRFGMLADNQTWDGATGYPNPDDRDDLAAHLEHHIEYARRLGVPVWIGEYGVNPQAENASELMAQKTELYDRYGIGRAWWLYTCGENFGLKDENCQWRPIADALS
jgi:hypothetical protein